MVGEASNIFIDIGMIFIIAALTAYVLRLIKQSQILAYVLVGILITPVFQLVTDTSIIESMSVIGIAFLLFIVGLEMDLKSLRNVALVSSLGGLIQISILFTLGYLIALLTGFINLEAAYVGLMLSFSSTMVVMKLLSDKRELHTLHGRLAVGVLLMEDIVAIFALSVLTSINDFNLILFSLALIKFIALFLIAYLTSRFIFPGIFKFAARNQELLLISSLAVCFLFSLVFYYLGFSIAIGAFIAGVALGNLDYSLEIVGKVKNLKDFFALLFFVSLGMAISVSVIKSLWLPLVILFLVIIILKPFLTMLIFSIFRYTKKPAFMTANALAQMGEFSLIIASQGLVLGHISQDLFSMAVILSLVTITLTSYYIEHSQFFYRILEKPLRFFDIFTTEGLEYLPTEHKPKVILCGVNRIGNAILKRFQKTKKEILVIDYNPEVIARMVREGYHCIYGEVSDEEIIERMNLKEISMLISTVPNVSDNLYLINKVRKENKKAKIIVTAIDVDQALELYQRGADYVVLPHFLGGEHVSGLIAKVKKKKIKLHDERKRHIKHLEERKNLDKKHLLHAAADR